MILLNRQRYLLSPQRLPHKPRDGNACFKITCIRLDFVKVYRKRRELYGKLENRADRRGIIMSGFTGGVV